MPEVTIDVFARVDERSVRDAKKVLAQGFEDDKAVREKLRRAAEAGEQAGEAEAKAHAKAYSATHAKTMEKLAKAQHANEMDQKFGRHHKGHGIYNDPDYPTRREYVRSIPEKKRLTTAQARAAQKAYENWFRKANLRQPGTVRQDLGDLGIDEDGSYYPEMMGRGKKIMDKQAAKRRARGIEKARRHLDEKAKKEAKRELDALGINSTGFIDHNGFVNPQYSYAAKRRGASAKIRDQFAEATKKREAKEAAKKRRETEELARLGLNSDGTYTSAAKDHGTNIMRGAHVMAGAKKQRQLAELGIGTDPAELQRRGEKALAKAAKKRQDKVLDQISGEAQAELNRRRNSDPTILPSAYEDQPDEWHTGGQMHKDGHAWSRSQHKWIPTGTGGKDAASPIRKRDLTPPDYPGATAKGRAQAEAKVTEEKNKQATAETKITKERQKQTKAAKEEFSVRLSNKSSLKIQKLLSGKGEISREEADEIVAKLRRKEQRKQREAAERAIKASRTNGTSGSGRGLPDDLVTGRVSSASDSKGRVPDKLLLPGKNVLDQYRGVGKADGGIGTRIPKDVLSPDAKSILWNQQRELNKILVDQTLKEWSDDFTKTFGRRPNKSEFSRARVNTEAGRQPYDGNDGLIDTGFIDGGRGRGGGSGGGRGGGSGQGRHKGGGNNPILGQVLTDLPFVPRGRAGAAIGGGVLVGLASIADAAVTASQSLALLPAVATAGAAAIGTLVIGFHGFGDAINNMGDPKKWAEALQGLSPAAQQAALSIQNLVQGPLGDLKRQVQDTLFAGMGEKIFELVHRTAPELTKLTTGIAGAFNQMGKNFMDQILTPETGGALVATFDHIVKAFENLAPAIGPFTNAIMQIVEVGSSFFPGFGKNITDAANSFNNFITQAKNSGALKDFMQKGIDAATALVKTLWSLGKGIFDTFGNKSPKDFQATLDSIKHTIIGVASAINAAAHAINNMLEFIRPVANALGGWDKAIEKAIYALAIFSAGKGLVNLTRTIIGVGSAFLGLPGKANTAATGVAAAGEKAGTGFAGKLKGGLMGIGWVAIGTIIGHEIQTGLEEAGNNWLKNDGPSWLKNFHLDLTSNPGVPMLLPDGPPGPAYSPNGPGVAGGSNGSHGGYRGGGWVNPNVGNVPGANRLTIPGWTGDNPTYAGPFGVPDVPGKPETDSDIRDAIYNSLNPADFNPLGAAGVSASGMPTGGSVLAGGPVDENSIRQWVQSNFGIPNSLGTGSWENASHPKDGGLHDTGQAFDFHSDDPQQMANLANWVARNASGSTKELIYSGPGFNTANEIKNGQFGDVYGPATNAGHTDHVHWAPGGMPQGGANPQLQYGTGGKPFEQPSLGYYDINNRDVAQAQRDVVEKAQAVQRAAMKLEVEKRAGIANQEEILELEQSLDRAKRDFDQSQRDLLEESAGKWTKVGKEANDAFGAALDPDFGISKGLPGIVENLTRMISNIAIAPMIGQLRGVQMANGVNPGDAGYGLLGIAHANNPPTLAPPGGSPFMNAATGVTSPYSPSYSGSPGMPGMVNTPAGPMPGPVPTAGATSGTPRMTLMSGHSAIPGAPLSPTMDNGAAGTSPGMPTPGPRAPAMPGMPTAPTLGPTAVVGRQPGSDWQAQGGIGGSGGLISGAPMAAIQGAIGAAAGAGDAFAPGAGTAASAAAQIGIELANRTAAFAGEAAGIGVQGLMETFGMSGSSLADPSNSWLGRLASGLAGARPAIGNAAGQQAAPMTKEQSMQDQMKKGAAATSGSGPLVHIENYTQSPNRSDQGAAKDIGRQFRSLQAHAGP